MATRKTAAVVEPREIVVTEYALKRREIAKAAAGLFYKQGYLATNVDEIARVAGLKKPSLYHYFAKKSDILYAIHEEFIDVLLYKQLARSDEDLLARESLL